MKKYYAGIGARKADEQALGLAEMYGSFLAKNGYILRSGGAKGMDTAFEKGHHNQQKEIILPWKSFNNNASTYYTIMPKAYAIAQSLHPNWDACSLGVKKLFARSVHQIMGIKLNKPVEFVLCWTPGGKTVGGTAIGIQLAKKEGIPVFNIFSNAQREAFAQHIKSKGVKGSFLKDCEIPVSPLQLNLL